MKPNSRNHEPTIFLRDAVDINEPVVIVCRADRTVGDAVEQIYVLLRR